MLVLVLVLVELFWAMHVYVLVSTWYVFCHAFLTMTSGPDGYYDMNRHGDGGDGGRDQGCWTQMGLGDPVGKEAFYPGRSLST